jgi:hypothetical protein
MAPLNRCRYCRFQYTRGPGLCPHCARPSNYPNVETANDPPELAALQKRYDRACTNAAKRRVSHIVRALQSAVSKSKAVIARSVWEADRLATSDRELYASYHALVDSGVQQAGTGYWNAIRGPADEALFPTYKDHIRFAALTLNNCGLYTFGHCYLILSSKMIAHRATAFHENSLIWFRHHDIKVVEVDQLPTGYRSTWKDRSKLAIAKLAPRIRSRTHSSSFPSLLLTGSKKRGEEKFIEIHIWGPLSIRSLERVTFTKQLVQSAQDAALLVVLKERLKRHAIPYETEP